MSANASGHVTTWLCFFSASSFCCADNNLSAPEFTGQVHKVQALGKQELSWKSKINFVDTCSSGFCFEQRGKTVIFHTSILSDQRSPKVNFQNKDTECQTFSAKEPT